MRLYEEQYRNQQGQLRIPMRGYEAVSLVLASSRSLLRIPMRGYEKEWQYKAVEVEEVTNPHAGL